MMHGWTCDLAMAVMLAIVSGCGGSPAAPAPPVDLNGVWTGVIGQGSGGGQALRLTWQAAQTGGDVSGPATVLTSPPTTDVLFSGTLSGKIAGSTLSLHLSAHPQQGAAECNLTGAGSASAQSATISGSISVSFVSCGTLQPPSNNQLTLTRD